MNIDRKEVYDDALEALCYSNGTIEFEEWFPAFIEDMDNIDFESLDELQDIFNHAENDFFNGRNQED